ncbi:putative phosphoenolpyruvate synthase [Trichonephila clavipes]|nr:putative phosphoenolpyruvate synthase [Trichonephila clavipes]
MFSSILERNSRRFTDALNFYAQIGVITGTVSVNDGPDHETYLFGERIRSLGKSANIVGCKFTSIIGNTPQNGLHVHLTNVTVPYAFKNLPFGFVHHPDSGIASLKELNLNVKPFTADKPRSSFKAIISAGNC